MSARPRAGIGRDRPRMGVWGAPRCRIGIAFSSLYALLLLVFGILPTVYAIYLAFTKGGAFVGFSNFIKVFGDYRFLPALQHVALYLLVWLVSLVILVVLLALVIHAIGVRWLSTGVRFAYYIPGALAGAASVMLWLFVLDPTVSPASFVLKALGFKTFVDVVQVDHLPFCACRHRFLDGRRRMDRRDVRRAQQHQSRPDRGRPRRWRRPDPYCLVDPDSADAKMDLVHGDPLLRRWNPALR